MDFSQEETLRQLLETLEPASEGTALVISGDISGRGRIATHLEWIAQFTTLPVYFVLGNHDFYHMTFERTFQSVRETCARFPNLHHLTDLGVIALNSSWAMIGHHGWGDGRAGLGIKTTVLINDSVNIHDLRNHYKPELWAAMNRLGDESATQIAESLKLAVQKHKRVLIVTHVPPFPEAAWHQGKMSGEDFLPHMCNLALGKTLREFALAHPDQEFVVLCGHTHSSGVFQAAPNLTVYTGAAEYGAPCSQGCFEVDEVSPS